MGSSGAQEQDLRSWRWRRHLGASTCPGQPAGRARQALLLVAWQGCYWLIPTLSPLKP